MASPDASADCSVTNGDDELQMASPYDEARWWQRATHAWVTPFLKRQAEDIARQGVAPPLPASDLTGTWAQRVSSFLDLYEKEGRPLRWLLAYIRVFWLYLLITTLYGVGNSLWGIMETLLKEKLLIFQEKQNSGKITESALQEGLWAAAALIAQGFVKIFLDTWYSLYTTRLNLRINAALVGAILVRSLRRPKHQVALTKDTWTVYVTSRGDGGGGSVYNLITLDCVPSVGIVQIILGVWSWPMQVWSASYLLYQRVQWSFLPGLALMLLIKLVSAVLLSCDGVLRNWLLARKDLRTALCSEAFTHVRTLQMLSWVEPFQKRILEARAKELKTTRLRLFMTKTNQGINFVNSYLVNLATFAFFTTVYKEHLKASEAIAIIGLIDALGGPLNNIPNWINQFLVFRSAYRRVNAFLNIKCNDDSPDSSGEIAEIELARGFKDIGCTTRAVIEMKQLSCSWPAAILEPGAAKSSAIRPSAQLSTATAAEATPLLEAGESFRLERLDFSLRLGEVLMIVGGSGSGKSSLLLALLQEMPLISGDIQCPSTPVPYSPQVSAIFSGSIRENILLGLPFETSIYKQVVFACDLEVDFETMPLGDSTDVGTGQTVSTGQRARIALARAVYCLLVRQRSLLLLDDPFAALDLTTCDLVCERLFGHAGLASHAAVVLCSSGPVSSLRRIRPRVLELKSAAVHGAASPERTSSGHLQECDEKYLWASRPAALVGASEGDSLIAGLDMCWTRSRQHSNAFQAAADEHPQTFPAPGDAHIAEDLECAASGGETNPESRRRGRVQFEVYKLYGAVAGWWRISLILFSILGIEVFQQFCDVWLAFWTDPKSNTNFFGMSVSLVGNAWSNAYYLRVYCWLVAIFCIFNFSGFWLEVWAGMVAARRLFEGATRVLWRSLAWWDEQPQGRVLNRFIADIGVVDNTITSMVGVITGAILILIGHTFFLALANPFSLVLVPPIVVCFEFATARMYRQSVRELLRIQLVAQSPFDQCLGEIIAGQITLRALGADGHAFDQAVGCLDRLQRAKFLLGMTKLWLGLRLAVLGYILTAFNTLYPALQFYGWLPKQSAGLIAFAIKYSSELIGIIQQLINNWSDLEMQLVSIERLQDYTAGSGNEHTLCPQGALQLPNSWPTEGRLDLHDVSVAYRDGLPLALQNVTFTVFGREKVAVVGRTGAGKSTLLKAILQLVKLRTGEVLVDKVPLREVHGSRTVAIVPQNAVIFSGSLRLNLDPRFLETDDALWAALHKVGLAESFSQGRDGLDTQLSQGVFPNDSSSSVGRYVELSAGQRQLLALARMALCGAKVVLLDEVTATLGHDAALRIVDVLQAQLYDRTALVVTHQQELLSLCSRILRVEGGCCREVE